MSDFGKNPPPGTVIIKAGKVEAGDWFFIATLGAWALCPPVAFGEDIVASGHIVARSVLEKHNVVKRAEELWRN